MAVRQFVTADNTRPVARRAVSGGQVYSVGHSEEEVARALADLAKRVREIEAAQAPDCIEFEVDLPGDGTTVTLEHGFGGPVRYFVTHWKETTVGGAPV